MRVLPVAIFAAAMSIAGASHAAAPAPPAITQASTAPAGENVTALAKPAIAVISQPEWQRQPSAEDLARFFPGQAALKGLSGKAMLRCKVKGDGTLEGCVIASETPVGLRFGEQALKLAPLYKMPPQAKGEPVAGKLVNIPVLFRLS